MRILLAACLFLALVLTAGCSNPAAPTPSPSGSAAPTPSSTAMPPAQTLEVAMVNTAFEPKAITIHVGDTVHWTDKDSLKPHNVVSDSKGNEFHSPDMDATIPTDDKEFSYTFKTAGTVDYVCTYHSGMTGTITVVT